MITDNQDQRYLIDETTGCWVWQKSINRYGYGRITVKRNIKKEAHRYFYESLVGPVPKGLQLDHLCRNRACVNPSHMEPVTHAENAHRGASSKINMTIARAIRRLYSSGRCTRKELAEKYGITQANIWYIINNKTWKEVPEKEITWNQK